MQRRLRASSRVAATRSERFPACRRERSLRVAATRATPLKTKRGGLAKRPPLQDPAWIKRFAENSLPLETDTEAVQERAFLERVAVVAFVAENLILDEEAN